MEGVYYHSRFGDRNFKFVVLGDEVRVYWSVSVNDVFYQGDFEVEIRVFSLPLSDALEQRPALVPREEFRRAWGAWKVKVRRLSILQNL